MEENVYDQAVLEDTIREAPGDSVELDSINEVPHILVSLVWFSFGHWSILWFRIYLLSRVDPKENVYDQAVLADTIREAPGD